jgi:hypothetical protein
LFPRYLGPEFHVLGDNDYSGQRFPFRVLRVFLLEAPDNPYPSSLAPVLSALQSRFPAGFDVEIAGLFFNAVFTFKETAGGQGKTADGIAFPVVPAVWVFNHFAFK